MRVLGAVAGLLMAVSGSGRCGFAQVATAPGTLTTVPAFPMDSNPLVIRRPAQPIEPFTVTGERGAIVGQQNGSFELWLLPVKVLQNVHLTARIKDYDAPIDLNQQAAQIEVRPDHTTITYAHAAITVKQHMFIPRGTAPGVGNAVVLFEVHAVRPAVLTLTFDPVMERMWPAPNFGRPSGGWTPVGTGGAYSLNTDNPHFFGVVAMPNAKPGELRPYQERPETEPMSFEFSYDPAKDDGRFYPLLCGVAGWTAEGEGKTGANEETEAQLLAQVLAQGQRIEAKYRATADFYQHFFDTRLTAETPDPRFNEAMRWAEVAIQQTEVASPHGAGLAGGWFLSGDSARPGFGWFFGRDTLWSLYAVNSYGDFALSREAMDFLFAHQRADGKMMHEVSQAADLVDWVHLPYLYAAADSTPLAVMQMEDYVRASGDVAYLKAHWEAIERAYRFTREHTTDGIYDNTQGTGWVEEWIENGRGGLPHQELYLAALDQQSAGAMSRLATLMGDTALAQKAAAEAEAIRAKLQAFRGPEGFYRFSRNADGTFEDIASIFPAAAWWNGRLSLPDAEATLTGWAGHRFATDWGERSVPTDAAIYDPISYHHGSVWPLYTGWASLADYRSGRSMDGYAALRTNVDLTWKEDLGDVTEVLSGAFYQQLGRSSSHQLWSSAMVISPAVRGLFGIEADALRHAMGVEPQLPASWDGAELKHVSVGDARYDVTMRRAGPVMEVDAVSATPTVLCLERSKTFFATGASACTSRPDVHHRLNVPLSAVEVALPEEAPAAGASTSHAKVLDEVHAERSLRLTIEAPGGSTERLLLRRNGPAAARELRVEGGTIAGDAVVVRFDAVANNPAGEYQTKTVTLRW